MDRGFLFVCKDDELLAEARASAERIGQVSPGTPTAIVTDADAPGPMFDVHVEVDELTGSFADKVDHIGRTPFERTVFLDTDTFLVEPVPELFDLLDTYDVAAAHAPHRPTESRQIPRSFPAYNTGVIAFREGDPTRALFDAWRDRYREHRAAGLDIDQPSFRHALYGADADVATLPPEYNCRSIIPGFLHDDAKLVHGRHYRSLESVAERLNSSEEMRVHYYGLTGLTVRSNTVGRLVRDVVVSYRRNGLARTVRLAARKLVGLATGSGR